MRRFVLGWKVLGHERRLRANIVNLADDFVMCCRGRAEEAMAVMRAMMQQLTLTVNEEKTTRCRIPDDTCDCLGYTIGRCYSYRTGRPYLGTRPSKEKSWRLCGDLSRRTRREWTWLDEATPVHRLNRMLVGWAHDCCLGRVRPAYRHVNHHAVKRLRPWWCHQHKVRGSRGTSRCSDTYLHDTLGLINIETLIRNRP
jgi:hypothetical protein